MITHHEVEQQLKAIGMDFRFWGRAEMNELEHILVPSEKIIYCLNGRYEGGFAMLCVTDQRIILIDKKPLYLTFEDIRYDMISEIDFSQRLIDATVSICTINKTLMFTAFKAQLLRQVSMYIQNRVMEFRQQHMMSTNPMQYIQTPIVGQSQIVHSIEHRITNPYTKVPLMMRRRLSRFHQ